MSGSSRPVRLVLLALLLAGAAAALATSVVVLSDAQDETVQSQVRNRTECSARMRTIRSSRHRARKRGDLIAAPASQPEVWSLVAYCETADASDAPALRDVALHATSPLAAANAVRALGRLHAMRRDAELLALLGDARERVRHATILALGDDGDVAAAPLVVPLVRGEDRTARLLALRSLARLGGDEARAALKSVREDPASTPDELVFASAAR